MFLSNFNFHAPFLFLFLQSSSPALPEEKWTLVVSTCQRKELHALLENALRLRGGGRGGGAHDWNLSGNIQVSLHILGVESLPFCCHFFFLPSLTFLQLVLVFLILHKYYSILCVLILKIFIFIKENFSWSSTFDKIWLYQSHDHLIAATAVALASAIWRWNLYLSVVVTGRCIQVVVKRRGLSYHGNRSGWSYHGQFDRVSSKLFSCT